LKTYPTPPPIPVFTKNDYFESIPASEISLDPNLK